MHILLTVILWNLNIMKEALVNQYVLSDFNLLGREKLIIRE